MVYTYSKAHDGDKKLSDNFKVREFACKDGSDTILIDDELVFVLQRIRDHFGVSVDINSGYRTEAHNKAVGGSAQSQHLLGKAADIVVKGIDPLVVGLYAAEILGTRGGIEIGDNYCHIDTRITRWRAFTHNGGKQYDTVADFGYKLRRV